MTTENHPIEAADDGAAPLNQPTPEATRITAIDAELAALDAKAKDLTNGREFREWRERRDALSQEKSMLQIRPVLDADPDKQQEREASQEQKPEQPQEQPREVNVDAIAPVEGLSDTYRKEAEGFRSDAAAIALDAGIPAPEMEAVYHFIMNRAVEDAEHDSSASLMPGQMPGPELADREACEVYIRHRYGSMADSIMKAAQAAFAKLPPDVQAYLDHADDNGRRLGNSPAVVAGLWLWGSGYAKLTPEAAAKELAQLRQSKMYLQRDGLTLDKVAMLNFLANRGQSRELPMPAHNVKLEQELKTLRLDAAYSDRYAPNHKQVVARVQAIMAELYPS